MTTRALPLATITTDPVRARLAHLIQREGEDMAGLSRMLGRPAGWLGRYVRGGVPRRLPDQERELLAGYFRVHPADLSARDLKAWKEEKAVEARNGTRAGVGSR